jgi:DNA-binding CsgD family transcriptional regulator
MAGLTLPQSRLATGADLVSPGALRMLDSADVPVIAFDSKGLQLYENAAFASLLGHELGEFDRRHIIEVIADTPEWTLQEVGRLRTTGRWRGLVSLAHKTGEPVIVEGKAILRSKEGEPAYFGILRALGPASAGLENHGIGAYGLTTHEGIVLQLMAEGLSDKDIARVLGVSIWTVHKQSGAVLQKLGATSRTLAAIRAVRQGLA